MSFLHNLEDAHDIKGYNISRTRRDLPNGASLHNINLIIAEKIGYKKMGTPRGGTTVLQGVKTHSPQLAIFLGLTYSLVNPASNILVKQGHFVISSFLLPNLASILSLM